jgi:hypothetical protein
MGLILALNIVRLRDRTRKPLARRTCHATHGIARALHATHMETRWTTPADRPITGNITTRLVGRRLRWTIHGRRTLHTRDRFHAIRVGHPFIAWHMIAHHLLFPPTGIAGVLPVGAKVAVLPWT